MGDAGTQFAPDNGIAAKTGCSYPPPIPKHIAAYSAAQPRVFGVHTAADARSEAKPVYQKHGSRRRPTDLPYRGGPEVGAAATRRDQRS